MRRGSDDHKRNKTRLTLYSAGFAAVEETREVGLTGEEKELILADVPSTFEDGSLVVEGLYVKGYTYAHDPVDRGHLLKHYIGQTLRLASGDERDFILHAVEGDGSVVLEDQATGEVSFLSGDKLLLPRIPEGYALRPTLTCQIEPLPVESIKVHYLAGGFGWRSHYAAVLSADHLTLTGWARIMNRSGKDFESVDLRLLAGDVKRVEVEEEGETEHRLYEASLASPRSYAEPESLSDYYAYTHPEAIALSSGREKELRFFHRERVAFKRHYALNLEDGQVDVVLTLQNDSASNLGVAIPGGTVQVYEEAHGGDLVFTGEDTLPHTPVAGEICLSPGRAFDISFDHKLMERKKSGGYEYYQYACTIENQRQSEAEIHFNPRIWETWEMVQSSHGYELVSSRELHYVLNVPAGGSVMVRYLYKVDRRVEVTLKENR